MHACTYLFLSRNAKDMRSHADIMNVGTERQDERKLPASGD